MGVVAAAFLGRYAYQHHQSAVAAEQQRRAGLATRADEQHQLVLQGDERGIYGAAGGELMRDIRR